MGSRARRPTGWDLIRIARAWVLLMERLGYERYVAQGGDQGASVTDAMARLAPEGPTSTSTSSRLASSRGCWRDCERAPTIDWLPPADRALRSQNGYSSFRQLRGSSGCGFGVRSSSMLKKGATNGSGAVTV
jgi:hypothetical protein